jgi:LacI family transcriptional regulator
MRAVAPSKPMAGATPAATARKMATWAMRARQESGATAVCFGDDEMAGFALREFARGGIAVPGELSVTGFDGLPLAAAFRQPLTTLGMPVDAMVDRVVAILGGGIVARRHIFDLALVHGESHGRAKPACPPPGASRKANNERKRP